MPFSVGAGEAGLTDTTHAGKNLHTRAATGLFGGERGPEVSQLLVPTDDLGHAHYLR
ncbi:hypothetical protein Aglo03_60460 [Actinokineospora globicatena]|uniref:Uncharacterized protein n=1 Tax=Actinokineospora globicatena TaxID=103729 RepID=A0A9W6QUS4_9PSEU|nr:hypothetical protein Aglo03_60460 [Actinokineospora globicatena]